jgi:hypothetical protein
MHYNFTKDLKEGEAVEQEVLDRVRRFVPANFLYAPVKAGKSYDLLFVNPFRGQRLCLEVKFDVMSRKTHNIAVEFQCSGQWSGIATTQAHIWVFKYFAGDWRYRAVYTQKLRDEWHSKVWPSMYAGDDKRARVFVVPVARFKTWGVAI